MEWSAEFGVSSVEFREWRVILKREIWCYEMWKEKYRMEKVKK